ncbi:MAG: flagellar biosynthetic protein FliQ [Oscillospiraceae bacterium]|nr:flagellar biosynthetic protein FliQ [Oscillospiraceae bacterium]
MDLANVSDMLRDAVGVALRLGGPVLILTMLVGVIVAVFQAVTQIHEQSIGFMLKLIVVVGVLLIGGGWMLETLQDFTLSLFELIAS